ncbi:MAG: T9SS type A sorting domain-containing protein [Rhodothermales bacterium]|nr:T9SS type A sorting domain-containing protein [Rhodothermales bacterium]
MPAPSGIASRFSNWALVILLGAAPLASQAQDLSVARQWNDEQLDAIRVDVGRPTVHARNLFHVSAVMYDGWAAYDETAKTFILGNTFGGHACDFGGVAVPADVAAARDETISFGAYRILSHRFSLSPNAATSHARFDARMDSLGYDITNTSTDYATGGPAELGNYIAQCMIDAGLEDGSNEQNNYASTIGYVPTNQPLIMDWTESRITDANYWQPIALTHTLNELGEPIAVTPQGFLTPHWSSVVPFSLDPDDLEMKERHGVMYPVYNYPGAPPKLTEVGNDEESEFYKWNFVVDIIWSSHLDPSDGVMWDISPASRGNNPFDSYPTTFDEYKAFYDELNGYVTAGLGHAVNPYTGQPYESEMVPRGDWVRVLAEFWADGPRSETPPGHWFTILNQVNEHPALVKKFGGVGDVVENLEWDVKGYFMLGAAVHDVAVTVWGLKSYEDYVRPTSAIRAMAERGQSTIDSLANYSPAGIPLYDGYIEVIEEGDPLAGDSNENVGKIKIYAWRGAGAVVNPATDVAGVDWILASQWRPYQAATFVTPPFAGYVSGHSTFSRAASEILTMMTGDEYFPGGLGEFHFTASDYLVFEDGPSVDMTLQWATYRDASDETSLSRIWGGIHPPIDDVPGRRIGKAIAEDVFLEATQFFNGTATSVDTPALAQGFDVDLYPNPVGASRRLNVAVDGGKSGVTLEVFNVLGQEVLTQRAPAFQKNVSIDTSKLAAGVYLVRVSGDEGTVSRPVTIR